MSEDKKVRRGRVEILEERISQLNERMSYFADVEKKNRTRIKSLEGQAMKLDQELKAFMAVVNDDSLMKAVEDARNIHALYRATWLKMTVSTETVYIARKVNGDPKKARRMALASIDAFDMPNDWWIDRQTMTLGRWMEVLEDIAKNGIQA